MEIIDWSNLFLTYSINHQVLKINCFNNNTEFIFKNEEKTQITMPSLFLNLLLMQTQHLSYQQAMGDQLF